ncbi:MAG: hypothetical protein JXR13_06950 [Thalassovita sp.]
MSETDSFIEEVSEEVRRDRLFGMMRRYGWIAILAVLAIVGGAAWNEVRKSQAQAVSEALGDNLITALELTEADARAEALKGVTAEGAEGRALVGMLRAAELSEAGQTDAALSELNALAVDSDLSQTYRDLAGFKALLLQTDTLSAEDRRSRLEALINNGSSLRILAEEQLAILEASSGQTQEALDRLDRIRQDAAATAGLRRRVSQLIVALGGDATGS